MKPKRVNPTAEANLVLQRLTMRRANCSRVEPLNRSSRREEAHFISELGTRNLEFDRSLLTSAATNGGFMGKRRGGHLARKPFRTGLSQVGSDTGILPRKNAKAAKTNSALSLKPPAFSPQPSHGLLPSNGPAHGGEQLTEEF